MKTEPSASLETIDLDQLTDVQGGNAWKAAGKFVGKKIVAPLGAVAATASAVSGYRSARKSGKGVGASLGQGALSAGKEVVGYDLWGPHAERALGK